MKKSGVLHSELSRVIAQLGHGQTIVVSDYGLPVPSGTPMIDLAIRPGIPSFRDVLRTILEELVIETCVIANELKTTSTDLINEISSLVGKQVKFVSHEEFKQQITDAVVVVRTGEHTPYANVILYAGVVF